MFFKAPQVMLLCCRVVNQCTKSIAKASPTLRVIHGHSQGERCFSENLNMKQETERRNQGNSMTVCPHIVFLEF